MTLERNRGKFKLIDAIDLPVVVHFGCGHLGLGAVLPFLIHQFGATHRIIAIQRKSEKWKNIPDDFILPLRTTAGDYMPFCTFSVEESSTSMAHISLKTVQSERRLLFLVPSISMCHNLLINLSNAGKKRLVISCSLGSGQSELVQLLRVFADWEKALIFENTIDKEWKKFQGNSSKQWHQVLVDRICWHVDPFKQDHKFVQCHCEPVEDVRFSWPEEAEIPEPSKIENVENQIVCGEYISEKWKTDQFNQDNKDWYHLRKRALINAPHAITALSCYRLLAAREMEADMQFLAPLQGMMRTEYPEWEYAIDHYLRLRAIQVAWESPLNKEHKQEILHADFSDAYQIAIKARQRFFATNDRLDRLMNRLYKELVKFEEHILIPTAFYDQNYIEIEKKWIYGHPNHIDLISIRDFLLETFV